MPSLINDSNLRKTRNTPWIVLIKVIIPIENINTRESRDFLRRIFHRVEQHRELISSRFYLIKSLRNQSR